jgi:hypothetical protein
MGDMTKKRNPPAITIADVEAAAWRFEASVRKSKINARKEMARLLFICRTWAVCCGADDEAVRTGGLSGLPRPGDGGGRPKTRIARVHWRGRDGVSACRQPAVGESAMTVVEADVTCGNCLRERAKSVEISQQKSPGPPALVPGGEGRECRKCGDKLPLEAFARDRQDWAGRKHICRLCDNRRRRAQAAVKRTAA